MFLRLLRLFSACVALGAAGCSIHPIPDNVSRYSTAEVVRNVRCEAKFAVRSRIRAALRDHAALRDIPADLILKPENLRRIVTVAPLLAKKFENYQKSAIAYDFEFSIDEANDKSANANFLMPFTSGGKWSLDAGASVAKRRSGNRRFKMVETFGELDRLDCHGYQKPAGNLLHPMTGSIGMARVMHTFINLTELGGGREKFTDTITFKTTVKGSVGGKLELSPLNDKFRIVGGDAGVSGERTDIHKLIVSLTFPVQDLRGSSLDGRGRGGRSIEADSKLRALEDLCIARAEQREADAGSLRLYPPEYYCRRGGGPRPAAY